LLITVAQNALHATKSVDIVYGMSKDHETARKEAPSKRIQNFRLTPETIRKLETAAREYGMSKTAYTELALKDRFKKDRIE
jgi:hypothetical protein